MAMELDWNEEVKRVMSSANREAQRFNHEYIGTEHVLLGIVAEHSCIAAGVLKQYDIGLEKVRIEVEKLVKVDHDMISMGELRQTPRTRKVLGYATQEALARKQGMIGSEDLLFGLIQEHDGVAAVILRNLGIKLEDLQTKFPDILPGITWMEPAPKVHEELEKLLTKVGLPQKPRDVIGKVYLYSDDRYTLVGMVTSAGIDTDDGWLDLGISNRTIHGWTITGLSYNGKEWILQTDAETIRGGKLEWL